MDCVVELLDRAATHRDVLAPVEADAGVIAAHDGIAVDRVAGEVELDVVGADDRPSPGQFVRSWRSVTLWVIVSPHTGPPARAAGAADPPRASAPPSAA